MRGPSFAAAFALDSRARAPHSWTVLVLLQRRRVCMRSTSFRLAIVVSIAFWGTSPAAAPQATSAPAVPSFQSIGPLTFGADGVLFAVDGQAAAIYAVNLGALPAGAAGTKPIPSIDAQIAAMLGAEARDISVTDLAVQP